MKSKGFYLLIINEADRNVLYSPLNIYGSLFIFGCKRPYISIYTKLNQPEISILFKQWGTVHWNLTKHIATCQSLSKCIVDWNVFFPLFFSDVSKLCFHLDNYFFNLSAVWRNNWQHITKQILIIRPSIRCMQN